MKSNWPLEIAVLGLLLVALVGCTGEPGVTTTVPDTLTTAANALIEAAKALLSWLTTPVSSSEMQALIAMSMVSMCYDLQRDQWITFRVPVAGEKIKVVTNACLMNTGTEDPDATWTYAMDYELSDSGSGRVLEQGTYHFRTTLTKFKPQDSVRKTEYTAAFFLDEKYVPTDGRFVIFNVKNFGKLKGAIVLRLRLSTKDPEVQDVVARLYSLEPTSEFRLDRMWLRITPRQQQQLAIGNVYPSDLLTDQEKRAITSKLWNPVAPAGIQGRHYHERKIYVVRDIEGSPVQEPIMPAGIYVDERLFGTMPVPEGGKRVRLAVRSLGLDRSDKSGEISLRWYGPTLADRRSYVLPLQDKALIQEHFFQGGLLEFGSRDPVMVKPEWPADSSEVDATPETLYTRVYVLHHEKKVKFAQFHVGDKPTPFRVDFRIMSRVEIGRRYNVQYVFLDQQDKVLRSGTIDFEAFPSKYDRALLGFYRVLVSDPVSFFLDVPPAVTSVVFHSSEPVLIGAYTRPPQLVKDTRVPEDFYREIPPSPLSEPEWFGVFPEHHEELLRESRSLLLKIQLRPPEDDKDVLAGRFLWEAFYATASWSGQHILTREDADIPYQRQEALLSGFSQLSAGEPLKLDIQSDQGLDVVRPILAFLRPDAGSPFRIGVMVDGEQLYDDEVVGARGTVWLPPLRAGHRTVTIEAPKDCTILMNSVAAVKPQHMLRFACLLDRRGLNVDCLKRSELDETLGMILYSPFGETKRTVIRAQLRARVSEGSDFMSGFTILDRRFTVKPSPEGPFPVMNAPTENVDGGQRLFFPLYGDIPPGPYTVRLDLEEGDGGYVVFSRVLPGRHEQRLIRQEAVLGRGVDR